MRFIIPLKLFTGLFAGLLLAGSCKKSHTDNAQPSIRNSLIAGQWTQQDIVLAVGVKMGGQNIPAGTSIITLAPLLGAGGAGFTCTKNNTYKFNTDGSYSITGCTDLILPKSGGGGNWNLDVHDAVLKLTSQKGDNDPHWIENISSTNLDVSLTVTIPGVATVPLVLKLKK